MTSTNADKSAMDLAGVEAGEKILVPGAREAFRSLVQPTTPENNRTSVTCTKNRHVEEFVLGIDTGLLLFLTSKYTPFPEFVLGADSDAEQITNPGPEHSIELSASALPKRGTRVFAASRAR